MAGLKSALTEDQGQIDRGGTENPGRGLGGLTMVNQTDFDPSRLSHFTLPDRRAKSAEKFRVSPLAALRAARFGRIRPRRGSRGASSGP